MGKYPTVIRTCLECKQDFPARKYDVDSGGGRYCSNSCKIRGNNRGRAKPPEERFWGRVARRGPDECWLWTGGQRGAGYGDFRDSPHSNIGSHRFAWILANGPIPDGLVVCHRCDVPLCCNPAHLFLGTIADNNLDRAAKGRTVSGLALHPESVPRGEDVWTAKLTPEIVLAIRASRERTKILSARYGVTASAIKRVRSGKTWRHLIPPAPERAL